MTQNNRILLLMSRCLSAEATPEEAEELRRLLQSSPDSEYLYQLLHSYFSDRPGDTLASPDTGNAGDLEFDTRFQRIITPSFDEKIVNGKSPRRFIKHFRYAAAFAALLGIGLIVYRAIPGRPAAHVVAQAVHNEEVQARAGARTKLLLPDGTQVWLNSNSKLNYSNAFNVMDREVSLEGEAFFDVTQNPQLPFIVHAASIDIQVLGTSFAVKSYPRDATVEATLLKGAIQISRKGSFNATRIILKPNEKLVFNKVPLPENMAHLATAVHDGHRSVSADISVNPIRPDLPDSDKVETGWMYNRLVFDGDNMQELAAKLERWYDVRISIRDEKLNRYHFGGAFQNEPIEEALKALQYTADFSYKIKGKEIEIYEKK
jgi:transmembrane sensor